MKGTRAEARREWVHGHLTEATRLATLLTAAPDASPRIAEQSIAAALESVPGRHLETLLADALLAQLVRRSLGVAPQEGSDAEQIRALAALPRRQRSAVVLRHYAELSDERAAVFLGCSPKGVADLAARGVAALPPDARADVRDWLEAAPSPRPAQATAPVLRRSLRRRALRFAGGLALVVALAVGGLRVPELLRPPEPPDPAERMAEIRRELDLLKAELPFDPDDPGAGASGFFEVSNGVLGGTLWSVRGYRDAGNNACLQLVVANDFGSRRCMTATTTPLHAIVETDGEHDVTFVSGLVGPRVETLHFSGAGVSWMDVPIGHEFPDANAPQQGFFGIALDGFLLPLESKAAGRRLGYRLTEGKLNALDAHGRPVASVTLVLAKRG